MGARFRSWGQQIKRHSFIVAGIIVVIFALTAFAIAIIKFGWDWTGFNGGYGKITNHTPAKDTELPPARTLWDWLQLLVIPLVLAVAALLFNRATTRAEQKIAAQRYEQDQQIALGKQHEDLLQAYLDRMSELLLEKDLRTKPSEEVKNVARVRTITVLTQLDARRVGYVFAFLREAGLMSATTVGKVLDFEEASQKGDPMATIFNDNMETLNGADLHAVNWSQANLFRANLTGADLTGANLNKANLNGADLSRATLSEANLSEANLSEALFIIANLRRANLKGANLINSLFYGANFHSADLQNADLRSANLSNANLSNANLHYAIVTDEQLAKAKSLKGATMPDGSEHS